MPRTVRQLLEQAARARREGRVDRARRHATEALALCRMGGSAIDLIRSLKMLANVERDMGHDDAAQPLYEEAAALCREEDDALALDLAHTVRHLGDVHRKAGRLGEAEECYEEALSIYGARSVVSPLEMANALRPMALLKEQTGDAAEARRLWREARNRYRVAGVQAGVEECSQHLDRLGPSSPDAG